MSAAFSALNLSPFFVPLSMVLLVGAAASRFGFAFAIAFSAQQFSIQEFIYSHVILVLDTDFRAMEHRCLRVCRRLSLFRFFVSDILRLCEPFSAQFMKCLLWSERSGVRVSIPEICLHEKQLNNIAFRLTLFFIRSLFDGRFCFHFIFFLVRCKRRLKGLENRVFLLFVEIIPRSVLHWSENHSNEANNGNNIALGERTESHALQFTSNPFLVRPFSGSEISGSDFAWHASMEIENE